MVNVLVPLSERALAEIDRRCGGPSPGGKHCRDGRGQYLARLIYRELGMLSDEALPRFEETVNLEGLDLELLNHRARKIARLFLAGRTVRGIVATLTAEGVPTVSGRPWTGRMVRSALASCAKKARAHQASRELVTAVLDHAADAWNKG